MRRSAAVTSKWCKRFKDGRTSVCDNPGHGGSQPTAVITVNIQRVERLILDNRRITCREIARETNLYVGTVNTIIHKHLHFRKVSTRWVPRHLTDTEELKAALSWSVLTGKARIFWIASLHVTKPGYIISLRNQNEHQSSGTLWIHHHQKNFEQLRLQVK